MVIKPIILILEQHGKPCDNVRSCLTSLGYPYEVCGQEEEMVEKLEKNPSSYMAALMDVSLLIGSEMTEKLPVLAIVNEFSDLDKPFCKRIGACSMLKRPLDPKELAQCLRDIEYNRAEERPLFDLQNLHGISMGDQVFIGQMIDLFLDTTPVRLEQLQAQIESEDFEKAKKTAHQMVSSFFTFGCERGALLCRRIEKGEKDPLSLVVSLKQVVQQMAEELVVLKN